MVAPGAATGPPSAARLSTALRLRTEALHARAERTGVIAEILAGTVAAERYLLLLDGLLPVYGALERGLWRHRHDPILAPFARPELFRLVGLEQDRATLARRLGGRPARRLAPALRYARRIEEIAARHPVLLLAHAYVRQLGDLSGGPILRRLLVRNPAIGPEPVRFYEFPGIADLARAKAEHRAALDRAGSRLADREAVLEEACQAFRLAIELGEAIERAEPARLSG